MWNFKTIIEGTATGLRISSVNGTAFLDNCPAEFLAATGIGSQVWIYPISAPTRCLQGFIGARGSNESLSADRLSGYNFTSGWGWVNATITGAHTFTTSGTGWLQKSDANAVLLGLFKGTLACTSNAGIVTQSYGVLTYLTSGDTDKYYTNAGSTHWIPFNIVTSNNSVDTWINYQVLAPSSNGCIILDSVGGNQNWLVNTFNAYNPCDYNAASYSYRVFTNQRI